MDKIELENGSEIILIETDYSARGNRSKSVKLNKHAKSSLDYYKRLQEYRKWIHMISYSKKKRVRNKYAKMAANTDEFTIIFLGE